MADHLAAGEWEPHLLQHVYVDKTITGCSATLYTEDAGQQKKLIASMTMPLTAATWEMTTPEAHAFALSHALPLFSPFLPTSHAGNYVHATIDADDAGHLRPQFPSDPDMRPYQKSWDLFLSNFRPYERDETTRLLATRPGDIAPLDVQSESESESGGEDGDGHDDNDDGHHDDDDDDDGDDDHDGDDFVVVARGSGSKEGAALPQPSTSGRWLDRPVTAKDHPGAGLIGEPVIVDDAAEEDLLLLSPFPSSGKEWGGEIFEIIG